MSIHSALQQGVRATLGLMATPGLQYRPATSGAWLNFNSAGAVFHAEATQVIQGDDQHSQAAMPMTAHIKVPDNGTELSVMATGKEWQVKDQFANVWAVVGKSRHLGQNIYSLVRVVAVNLGHPNGTVP